MFIYFSDNILQQLLKDKKCTSYRLLQLLHNLANFNITLRTFVIDTCKKGCTPFYKDNINSIKCSQCEGYRWRKCSPNCYDAEQFKM